MSIDLFRGHFNVRGVPEGGGYGGRPMSIVSAKEV